MRLFTLSLLVISLTGCTSETTYLPTEDESVAVSQALQVETIDVVQTPTQEELDTPLVTIWDSADPAAGQYTMNYYYKVKHRFIGSRDSIEEPAKVTVFEGRLHFNHQNGSRYSIVKNGREIADLFPEQANELSQFHYIITAEKEGAFEDNQEFIDLQLQDRWGLIVRGPDQQVHVHIVSPMQTIQEPYEL